MNNTKQLKKAQKFLEYLTAEGIAFNFYVIDMWRDSIRFQGRLTQNYEVYNFGTAYFVGNPAAGAYLQCEWRYDDITFVIVLT